MLAQVVQDARIVTEVFFNPWKLLIRTFKPKVGFQFENENYLVKTAQKCTEDDGGANFFKFSKTTDKSGLTREDWCYRASGQSAVGVTLLQERYCRSDGSMASPIVDCNDDPKSGYAPSGCKEKYNAASCACKAGACVPLIAIGK